MGSGERDEKRAATGNGSGVDTISQISHEFTEAG